MRVVPGRSAVRATPRRGSSGGVALLTAALALGICAVASAASTRHVSNNHFEVVFPEGWVRIEDAAAREYADAVARLMGQRPTYEAFYERADAQEHFAYPYVAVDFHAADTRFYREFSAQMEKGFKSAADTVVSRADGFLSDIEFGKPVLEAPLSRFWVKMKMEVTGVSVTGLSLLKMGAKGIAVVNFYALTEDFESHEAEFRSIADSCRFESGWRHDPLQKPSILSGRWGNVALFGGIGALVGLILAIVRARSQAPDRVRLASYVAPPPGAPLSRQLMNVDDIGRAPPPPPRPPEPVLPQRPKAEDSPLIDPSPRRIVSGNTLRPPPS